MKKICSDSMDITVVHSEPNGDGSWNVYARGFDEKLYKYDGVLYRHSIGERINCLLDQGVIWLDYWTQVEDKFND